VVAGHLGADRAVYKCLTDCTLLSMPRRPRPHVLQSTISPTCHAAQSLQGQALNAVFFSPPARGGAFGRQAVLRSSCLLGDCQLPSTTSTVRAGSSHIPTY
jgi:hypothetical protein